MLKLTQRQITTYYAELERLDRLGITNEFAVRVPFQTLLEYCGRQFDWTLAPEHSMTGHEGNRIQVDGALIDEFKLVYGCWEAKGLGANLPAEVKRKLEHGYPRNNIIFQTPQRAILWQNNQQVLDVDLTDATKLVEVLQTFFAHRPQEYVEWEDAVAQFKDRVAELGEGLAELIAKERETNREFTTAFADFHEKCCQSINPNLSEAAVEEMLIQHLLTERIFRTVFSNSDFTRRNVIAREIETVINVLMSHSLSREDFLHPLDRFYVAIERTAALINDFSQKQSFLNTVYEQFFQGFSVKVADTHGIVYTPQPIVDFMVRSVEEILKTEFNNRSLSDHGVHIIDPFVGTGNFIVRVMREIRGTDLEYKYMNELHSNELMLLAYYIASMNIEHEFYQATRSYRPFEGNCFADTFEDAEKQQLQMFTPEHTERVERQRKTDMFVIIGNPPYNAGQVNENDNNKNRKYKAMDKRVAETYSQDSRAVNKNALSDPYVKAIRWASDRIGDEGVVAFVTNNSFLDGIAFDGMRKHLHQDFNCIYILDLKGNVRKDSMREEIPIGEKHTVFGLAAMVGIAVTFLVKSNQHQDHKIYYSGVDWKATRQEKFNLIENASSVNGIKWKELTPDKKHTWLTEGLHAEFETCPPMGKKTKVAKGETGDVIFKTYSRGIVTCRDAWAYNFNRNALAKNMSGIIDTYNEQVFKWERQANRDANVDDFVVYDDSKISWSRDLKLDLNRGRIAEYTEDKVRNSLYRPFTKSNLFFDRIMNEEVYSFPSIFPIPETETENQVICLTAIGSKKPFHCLMTQQVTDFHLTGDSQCFPFYIYDEGGENRRENITDWALAQYRAHYRDDTIEKWDIFHYVYALLHHPDYRERYQANLKRDLPHLPYTPDFWRFAKAGQRLGEIHVGYEDVPEYQLDLVENRDQSIDWHVEKMRLSKDKTQIVYNDFLTLDKIPAKAFEYRLGNRSALEWIINQYCIKTNKRSGITNDPNRPDDPQYILKLIGKVITVSLETVEVVEALPGLDFQE